MPPAMFALLQQINIHRLIVYVALSSQSFAIRCMLILIRIDIHSRFRSTRCKTMYCGVIGTFGPYSPWSARP
jgi:hypothetical protein